MKELIFINSHPIQYFTPMYQQMQSEGMPIEVWYCSDESIRGAVDLEFNTQVKWDIPLLEGYPYQFFKNYARKPSIYGGFTGLINWGIIRKLSKHPKSVIVVHGWHYLTHLLVLLLGKAVGHTVCLRCDAAENQEALKKGWLQGFKYLGFKYLLFPCIDYFLYVGTQNRRFYEKHGIAGKRLINSPYAVDNQRFTEQFKKLKKDRDTLRQNMHVPLQAKIILFTAKYIEKKRPLDLIKAFQQLNDPDCWLIMVGTGPLQESLQTYIHTQKLNRVILTGFVNQNAISDYYAISDVFVMCSGAGENWGLSVNEAMNFNLPIIVSDQTGCSIDLVVEGRNGYVFPTGEVDALAQRLKWVLTDKRLTHIPDSAEIIQPYSYDSTIESLRSLL
ncbi:glycosyltransferase family 4 protein [Siphonobacter sp. SORGH_AS_1065]|uniref:glycosyltransferase family 4 protein n=1 Tax=Siphonobacter sp. SORGH_AS_1065 TaxID=3041795 RepID=UPI0027837D3B|nr:glycosyltransferase family 4 protein [Siphonobacter sp. SORGH_AS_1065]MDQ1085606.1 glycosyltransferase involved in cell wall biosynthesis [Siphonobacter sp. SORGH_AS_1065]